MLLVAGALSQAQDQYMTKEGYTKFFSSAPLEDIEAHNQQVQSLMDLTKQEVVVSIPMQAFEFKKSLMREHFNENYVESEKYPKPAFSAFMAQIPEITLCGPVGR